MDYFTFHETIEKTVGKHMLNDCFTMVANIMQAAKSAKRPMTIERARVIVAELLTKNQGAKL